MVGTLTPGDETVAEVGDAVVFDEVSLVQDEHNVELLALLNNPSCHRLEVGMVCFRSGVVLCVGDNDEAVGLVWRSCDTTRQHNDQQGEEGHLFHVEYYGFLSQNH